MFIVLSDLPPTGVVTRFRVVSVLGLLVCASHYTLGKTCGIIDSIGQLGGGKVLLQCLGVLIQEHLCFFALRGAKRLKQKANLKVVVCQMWEKHPDEQENVEYPEDNFSGNGEDFSFEEFLRAGDHEFSRTDSFHDFDEDALFEDISEWNNRPGAFSSTSWDVCEEPVVESILL